MNFFFKSLITFKKMNELDDIIQKDIDIVIEVDKWIINKFFDKYEGYDDGNAITYGFIDMNDDYDYWYNSLDSKYVEGNFKLSTYIRHNLDLIYYEGLAEELERLDKFKKEHYGKYYYRKKIIVCKCDSFKIDTCKCK